MLGLQHDYFQLAVGEQRVESRMDLGQESFLAEAVDRAGTDLDRPAQHSDRGHVNDTAGGPALAPELVELFLVTDPPGIGARPPRALRLLGGHRVGPAVRLRAAAFEADERVD